MPHPYLDHPGPLPIVHRGGAGEAAENSAAAFRRAAALGFTHVETDVHVTADGVVLAFHDHRLDRATDSRGAIEELTWAEVRRARIAGTEPIPRLADLLSELPDVRFALDPKHDAAVRPLAELLRRADALDRVCLGSFSDRRLAWLRAALGPRACLALGPRGVAALRVAATTGRAARLPPAQVAAVPARVGALRLVDRRFVAAAHAHGLRVHVWTVDDPDEMERLLDLGVDGLMTDLPLVLRDVLVRRGSWPPPLP